nr:hypothetical protein [Gemmatimonadaceae bacterium]
PVFLLYDSDEAGLKATFRAGLALLREGVAVRVATLPEGEDPDSFVRAHGAAGLDRLLADAIDVFDRQLQLLDRRGWFAELHLKRKAIDKLLPTIRATADPLTRELYLARLGEVSGIDRALLQREADATPDVRAPSPRAAAPGSSEDLDPASEAPPPNDPHDRPGPTTRRWTPKGRGSWSPRGQRRGPFEPEWRTTESPPPPPRIDRAVALAERTLVRLLWHRRELIEQAVERRGPDMLHGASPRAIYEVLLAQADAPREAILEQLDTEAIAYAESLSAEDGDLEDAPQMLVDTLRKLELFDLEAQIDELERARALASEDERASLETTVQALRAEARALGGRWRRLR